MTFICEEWYKCGKYPSKQKNQKKIIILLLASWRLPYWREEQDQDPGIQIRIRTIPKMSRIQNTGSQFRLIVHESSIPLTVSKLPEASQNNSYGFRLATFCHSSQCNLYFARRDGQRAGAASPGLQSRGGGSHLQDLPQSGLYSTVALPSSLSAVKLRRRINRDVIILLNTD